MLTPFPYQSEAIEHLAATLRPDQPGVLDGSDCGMGKTLVALEIVKRFNRPTLVVCPKPVRPSWERHAAGQRTEVSTMNWEMARTGRTPFGEWKLPSPRHRIPKFYWNPAVKMLVFDEVHRAMTFDSKNAEMVIAARRQRIPTLALSATAADTPLELNSLGYLLGLHDGVDPVATLRRPEPVSFLDWARKHNCRAGARHELEFFGDPGTKSEVMARIHSAIYPDRGVRKRIKDVGDLFPESQISSELYDLGDASRIAELEAAMEVELAVLREKQANDKPHPLTEILRLRQEIELLKVPGLVELSKEVESQGRSVAIFVNFTQTIQAVCGLLDTTCIIDGSQVGVGGANRREHNRLRFQTNHSHFIICNAEAGGLGLDLHDINDRPRTSHIFPGYNAKTLRQVLGRIWRAGSLSKSIQRILGATGTIDERVHFALMSKLNNLDALNDGDLC